MWIDCLDVTLLLWFFSSNHKLLISLSPSGEKYNIIIINRNWKATPYDKVAVF